MKKYFKFSALLLSAAIVLSSCIGSFKLTNNIKDWNETVSTKWVNEVVFLALHIVPVYPIAMMVDGVVLNSMEFWTGENLVIEKGEKKVVENSNGETVEITALENGYNITNGVTSMNLVFDEAERVWSAEYDNQTTKLVKLVGGEVMDVTRDQISNGFALK